MLRKLVLAAVSAALTLSVLAIPVAAVSPPTALEINAIPGTNIDICQDGQEVVTGLRYSRATRWDSIDADVAQTWKLRKAAAGKCKGKLLAKFTYTFAEGNEYTIVYWRPKDAVKMRVYTNDPVPLGPGETSLTFRHMATTGAIDVMAWQLVPAPAADLGPTVAGLRRGYFSDPIVVRDWFTGVTVFPTKATPKWSGKSTTKNLSAGKSYQVVFMGTAQKNMKLKFYAWPNS